MKAKRPILFKYGIAILSIILGVGLTLVVRQWFTLNPTPLILVSVIGASWFGGRYPGLLACVLADVSIDFFFEVPQFEFTLAPVHFVRLLILSVVSLLASSRREAEDRLKIKERQQAAVALFGQEALSSIPLDRLLPAAVRLVRKTLNVDISAIGEPASGKDKLRLVAADGLSADDLGSEFDHRQKRSLAGHVFQTGQSVVIRDLRKDTRFETSEVLKRHRVRSCISVPISQGDATYGVLGAFDRGVRSFSNDDVSFLLSVANIIASASARLRSEAEISEHRSWLNTTLSSIGDGVIATDVDGNISFMNPVAEKLTGWTQADANGKALQKVFHIVNESSRNDVINPVEKVLATGSVVGLANHTILISRDGTEIPIDDSAAPIRDGDQIRGVVLVFSDVSERKLAEQSKRENEIMARLVEAQESERHRIARDLHDHLGQKMTALRLEIGSLVEKCADNRELGQVVSTMQDAALQIDRDIGFLSWELRPTELENLGLDDALSSFVREWSKQYNIGAEFHTDKVPTGSENGRLSRSTETNVYRIVQEALNNILKHADAKNVSVLMHHRKEHVVVIIEDDGIGFDDGSIDQIGSTPGGLGLIGMRERVALMQGTLDIDSEVGRGTTIMARIPVNSHETA